MKPRILALVSAYLPGYLAGGPIRSLSNLVQRLGDEFDFMIVTSDRDIGASETYHGVKLNTWNNVGKARVYYVNRNCHAPTAMLRLIQGTPYDLLYLNSFFDPVFSIMPIYFRRFGLIGKSPVLIAPRGEFSEGAIRIKYIKKTSFLAVSKVSGAYEGVWWHASTVREQVDVSRVINNPVAKIVCAGIVVARDLSDELHTKAAEERPVRDRGVLRICFLSRISRMKNLDYALKILQELVIRAELTIVGPKEDLQYWKECERLIEMLPSNVTVKYVGSVPNERVCEVIAEHDIFFLPTRGENFGHVFMEAWSAGVPVLTSDQTPWERLEPQGVGWDVALDDPKRFVAVLAEVAKWSPEQHADCMKRCMAFAARYVVDIRAMDANREMLKAALGLSAQEAS